VSGTTERWRDLFARFAPSIDQFTEGLDRRAAAREAGVPSALFHEVDEIQRDLEALAFEATMADAYAVWIAEGRSRANEGPGWEEAATIAIREGTGPVTVADILARLDPDSR
jgi:hypothetical protein